MVCWRRPSDVRTSVPIESFFINIEMGVNTQHWQLPLEHRFAFSTWTTLGSSLQDLQRSDAEGIDPGP
jgi:hypothetical protein